MNSKLFSKFNLRGISSANRIVLSPLCMYSAIDGVPNDWHFSHLSTYARAGVGIIFTEATAVQEIGRITPYCCGIWNDQSKLRLTKKLLLLLKNQDQYLLFN